MSEHSVADARNNLSKLIERAEAGETIAITRHGRHVANLTPPKGQSAAKREWSAEESLAFLDRARVKPLRPITDEMRGELEDDGWQ